jgi:thioredoxin 1
MVNRSCDPRILYGAMVHLTDAEFESQVLQSPIPVLMDFSATWCAPCKAIAPTLDALAKQYEGKVKIAKIECDEELLTAERYGIRAFPTLLMFKNGKVVDQLVGAAPKTKLEALIQKAL